MISMISKIKTMLSKCHDTIIEIISSRKFSFFLKKKIYKYGKFFIDFFVGFFLFNDNFLDNYLGPHQAFL
jgi:hypothetical protein